jgi:hypothetical protein
MHLPQKLNQKSVARKSMILLAAVTLSTAVATGALAAGHAGGGGGFAGGSSGGRVGGGFGGGGLASGHASAGFVGGGFATGHTGSGFVGPRMGGGVHDRDHERDHHFHESFVVVPLYDDYNDDYDYGLGDYAGDGACFQYRHVHITAGWQWRQVWVCN